MFINTQVKRIATMSVLAFSLNANSADFYQITNLGSLDENIDIHTVEAFAINNASDVVGNSNGANFNTHAFIHRNDQMNDLGFLPFETTGISGINGNSFAFGINNNNIAVGYSTDTVTEDDPDTTDINETALANIAVYYDTDNLTINKIPQFDLEVTRETRAAAVNDNNIVVGFADVNPTDDVDSDGNPLEIVVARGFYYNIASGELGQIALPTDEELPHSVLRSVNNNNYAVGLVADTVSNGFSTFIVSGIIGVDLNNPEIVTKVEIFGGTQDQVWDINDQGIFVGSANKSDDGNVRAISYDINSQSITELGVLNENFIFSEALSINDTNQIVGSSQVQNSPSIFHAFIHEDGAIKDLDKLIGCDTGWTLNKATSINDSGVIIGTGLFNGEKRAFMLNPIAGTAPTCEDENDSGGSLPLFLLFALSSLTFIRRKL